MRGTETKGRGRRKERRPQEKREGRKEERL
jgi:hypothetical protein